MQQRQLILSILGAPPTSRASCTKSRVLRAIPSQGPGPSGGAGGRGLEEGKGKNHHLREEAGSLENEPAPAAPHQQLWESMGHQSLLFPEKDYDALCFRPASCSLTTALDPLQTDTRVSILQIVLGPPEREHWAARNRRGQCWACSMEGPRAGSAGI